MMDDEVKITLTNESSIFKRYDFVPGMLIRWSHSNIDSARILETDDSSVITMIIDSPAQLGLILRIREGDDTLFGKEIVILDEEATLLTIFSAFAVPL
jgi:hypothetical protein